MSALRFIPNITDLGFSGTDGLKRNGCREEDEAEEISSRGLSEQTSLGGGWGGGGGCNVPGCPPRPEAG